MWLRHDLEWAPISIKRKNSITTLRTFSGQPEMGAIHQFLAVIDILHNEKPVYYDSVSKQLCTLQKPVGKSDPSRGRGLSVTKLLELRGRWAARANVDQTPSKQMATTRGKILIARLAISPLSIILREEKRINTNPSASDRSKVKTFHRYLARRQQQLLRQRL